MVATARRFAFFAPLAVALALASPAQALKVPTSIAKSKSVKATKSFWKHKGFRVLERPRVTKCHRYGSRKVRCKTDVILRDKYGCGYGTLLVTVRYVPGLGVRTKAAHDVWHPYYDPTNKNFDTSSCDFHGLRG